MMKSSVHSEEDDFVPELQRSIHPRERPDWEETLSAMVKHLPAFSVCVIFGSAQPRLIFQLGVKLSSLSFRLSGLHSTFNKTKILPFSWQFVKERFCPINMCPKASLVTS